MILRHYTDKPLTKIRAVPPQDQPIGDKPLGLWLSDDSQPETSWPAWCRANYFNLDRFALSYDVELGEPRYKRNILYLKDALDFDYFSANYRAVDKNVSDILKEYIYKIDWFRVAVIYDGILISPFQYQRCLTPHTAWYRSWDCASGCIWNPRSINSFKLVQAENSSLVV